jgi:hypothetical protein
MQSIKSPEDLKEPYFTMETSLEPSNLARASELLLNRLSPKLKQSWFDIYLQAMPDFVEAVNIARQYVTKIRLNISPQEEVIDYKETEDKAFVICPNYRDFGNCKYWQSMNVKKLFVLPIFLFD